MAKSKGLIQFEGALGPIIAYDLNGKSIIKRKPIFDADKRKNAQSFQPQRNNNKEFGAASMLSKYIRTQMNNLLGDRKQGQIHNRLTQKILSLIKASTGPHGKRTPNWQLAQHYLKELNLLDTPMLDRYIQTLPQVVQNNEHLTLQLNGVFTNLPKACSHISVHTTWIALPEVTFNTIENNYLLNKQQKPQHLSLEHWDINAPLNQQLSLNYPNSSTNPYLLVVVKLEGYEWVNNNFLKLNPEALCILKCVNTATAER